MIHPNPQIQKKQRDFLLQCPTNEREYHASIFRIGNATIIYHQLASNTSPSMLKSFYLEWLEGLTPNVREDMEKKGFDYCKTVLPFSRYVNERKDIGMDEWMKQHLSEEDYNTYKSSRDENTKVRELPNF